VGELDSRADGVRILITGGTSGLGEAMAVALLDGGGRVVNVSMNHSTMNRTGFVPYGPARAGAEGLSRIMAADLAGSPVTVNVLLPGGATATGMIPEGFPPELADRLLDPAVMAAPIRWLASPAAAGVHDQRIVATEFADWLATRDAC
jgi:NAD(P)-dependent dehydrogenase (short-subunit alcohol dehydrogenase family)